jgi:hypothetical protein
MSQQDVTVDIAPQQPALSVEDRKIFGRSRISNHNDLLPGLDGRSAAARRYRDLVNSFLVDMGGIDAVSEIKLGLLRRLAATTIQAELIEAKLVNGEQIDVAVLCTLASITVRLSQRLGLERRPREVPNLLAESEGAECQ